MRPHGADGQPSVAKLVDGVQRAAKPIVQRAMLGEDGHQAADAASSPIDELAPVVFGQREVGGVGPRLQVRHVEKVSDALAVRRRHKTGYSGAFGRYLLTATPQPILELGKFAPKIRAHRHRRLAASGAYAIEIALGRRRTQSGAENQPNSLNRVKVFCRVVAISARRARGHEQPGRLVVAQGSGAHSGHSREFADSHVSRPFLTHRPHSRTLPEIGHHSRRVSFAAAAAFRRCATAARSLRRRCAASSTHCPTAKLHDALFAPHNHHAAQCPFDLHASVKP